MEFDWVVFYWKSFDNSELKIKCDCDKNYLYFVIFENFLYEKTLIRFCDLLKKCFILSLTHLPTYQSLNKIGLFVFSI